MIHFTAGETPDVDRVGYGADAVVRPVLLDILPPVAGEDEAVAAFQEATRRAQTATSILEEDLEPAPVDLILRPDQALTIAACGHWWQVPYIHDVAPEHASRQMYWAPLGHCRGCEKDQLAGREPMRAHDAFVRAVAVLTSWDDGQTNPRTRELAWCRERPGCPYAIGHPGECATGGPDDLGPAPALSRAARHPHVILWDLLNSLVMQAWGEGEVATYARTLLEKASGERWRDMPANGTRGAVVVSASQAPESGRTDEVPAAAPTS